MIGIKINNLYFIDSNKLSYELYDLLFFRFDGNAISQL